MTFPDQESFEGALSNWTQSTSDNFDWQVTNLPTPTNSTGPSSSIHGASYLYAEATGNTNGFASIESCVTLSDVCSSEIEFDYHMFGANVVSLLLEVSTDSGTSWTSLWSESGDQGDNWYVRLINLDAYAGSSILLRFTAQNNGAVSYTHLTLPTIYSV